MLSSLLKLFLSLQLTIVLNSIQMQKLKLSLDYSNILRPQTKLPLLVEEADYLIPDAFLLLISFLNTNVPIFHDL